MGAFERWLVAANRWLLIGMLAAMACMVFTNVVLRYATNESLVWVEEISRYLMIWITFLGAGLVLRFGGHIAIEDLHDKLPGIGGRILRTAIVVLMMAFFAAMAWNGVAYLEAMQYQTTPVTGVSFAWVYSALPIGFVLLMVHLALVARRYILTRSYLASSEMNADAAASI
jgi:TRAP-type C4-dicarboxylate transport system permease small subunit